MSDIFLLYIFTRADAASDLLSLVTFVSTILAGIWWMAACGALSAYGVPEEKAQRWGKVSKQFAIAALVGASLTAMLPSQKDLMFILAGVGVLEVAKSETAQRIAGKSVQVIEQYLDGLVEKPKEAK